MNGPLQIFCLFALFNLFSSLDANTVAGAVDIKEVAGVHSKEDEISKLQYYSSSGKEQITIRPEINNYPNFQVSNCSNNGPCGSGGSCVYFDEELPIRRVVCHCYSGYRGRYCNESYRTKLGISFFFWGVFVIEVVLIGIALFRSADESSYPSSPTARPLVFILQEKRLD
ncbi:hypothetical protein PRIPAC_91574 [Pristionchus pacificus]|uniref:EGF-like domain-containing protein n=1 Tax=Pristionchus pacificus TaxID=54126 RepID=A0A2A6BRA5_PRIPA|nr:hypothetical protein PRIPAC_91574 [Pristionchus pacificus]|eukprot:PDM68323.1 hypothetical protein PRIPAC_46367 [Pristionchus pacificus]